MKQVRFPTLLAILCCLCSGNAKCQGVMNSSAVVFSTGKTGNITHLLPRTAIPLDTKVTITVEAAPLESMPLTTVLPDNRGDHWQIMIRDAQSGEAIQGLGWGRNEDRQIGSISVATVIAPPLKTGSIDVPVYEGKVYEDSRWNSFEIAINPETGKPYPTLQSNYKTAVDLMNSAGDQWKSHNYYVFNNTGPGGAAIGSEGFYQSRNFNGTPADNCHQFARFAFAEAEKRSDVTMAVMPTKSGIVNLDTKNIGPSVSFAEPQQGDTYQEPTETGKSRNFAYYDKGVLHSLADLLETGEEIVEVREDLRADRRERKAREQAERERKAAEEERLRQQQPDAQRRKAQSEQKKSKSSGAEVARRPTPTTQQNRPAGTKPATETGTEPTDTGSQTSTTPPAQTTVRIDFTPLDNCTSILNSSRNLIGSLAASMVEVAMSDGEKAYSKLKSQIASLPDGDRKQQLEQTLEAKYAAFKAAKSYYE